jgi:hypothetical protein
MSEMVDRVARAICKNECAFRCGGAEDCQQYDDWIGEARAAIAAMREPTEKMHVAGHDVRSDPQNGMPTYCGVDEIWTAMIDAALADE